MLPIVEDACEALGGSYADGGPIGGRGHPAVFAFYANKQMTTGEGGMVADRRRGDQGAHGFRAQPGPCARTWTGSTTTGSASTTGCPTSPVRSGWHSSNVSTRCSPAASALPRSTARRSASSRASRCRARTPGRRRRGWFVYVIQLPHGVDRDSVVTALGTARGRGQAVLPGDPPDDVTTARQFGYREGQFPVCEDVSARSIAIPFFPQMTEAQVARVGEALAAVLGAARRATGPLASRA